MRVGVVMRDSERVRRYSYNVHEEKKSPSVIRQNEGIV